jgi:hypothetical protein
VAKNRLRWNRSAVPFLKIVESDDAMAAGDEHFGADTADIAGRAGDENVQEHLGSDSLNDVGA